MNHVYYCQLIYNSRNSKIDFDRESVIIMTVHMNCISALVLRYSYLITGSMV